MRQAMIDYAWAVAQTPIPEPSEWDRVNPWLGVFILPTPEEIEKDYRRDHFIAEYQERLRRVARVLIHRYGTTRYGTTPSLNPVRMKPIR